jgi:hypothetical protein
MIDVTAEDGRAGSTPLSKTASSLAGIVITSAAAAAADNPALAYSKASAESRRRPSPSPTCSIRTSESPMCVAVRSGGTDQAGSSTVEEVEESHVDDRHSPQVVRSDTARGSDPRT